MDARSFRNMYSNIAVTNKHTAKLHHVGSFYIYDTLLVVGKFMTAETCECRNSFWSFCVHLCPTSECCGQCNQTFFAHLLIRQNDYQPSVMGGSKPSVYTRMTTKCSVTSWVLAVCHKTHSTVPSTKTSLREGRSLLQKFLRFEYPMSNRHRKW